eukprot:scaffold4316_cov116-Isochrysis_galbana.AAC.7
MAGTEGGAPSFVCREPSCACAWREFGFGGCRFEVLRSAGHFGHWRLSTVHWRTGSWSCGSRTGHWGRQASGAKNGKVDFDSSLPTRSLLAHITYVTVHTYTLSLCHRRTPRLRLLSLQL